MQTSNINNDEIDLFELIEAIWKEKFLIIAITAIFTLLAVAYALVATPVYQATTTFYQPSASSIQAYNLGRKEANLEEFNIPDIYSVFLTNLNSQQLRNEFFEEVYLPSLTPEQQLAPRDRLLTSLSQTIQIKQVDPKENKFKYQISVEREDAEQAAQWANQYVQKAIVLTKQELAHDIQSELSTRKASIQLKIDSMLAKAQAERQDEIIRLKEALSIAKAIGLENPSLPAGKTTEEGANYVDRNLTYMRGSKALASQIEVLENRENDLAFVPELRDLTAQLNFLKNIILNDENTEVVKIDNVALTPETPIKPKKVQIVAIGIVLGGMLGGFAALVRIAIRQRKASAKNA